MRSGFHEVSTKGESLKPELRLLLACAAPFRNHEADTAIKQMLVGGIDWAVFARKAMDHGLAALAGATLDRIAADRVPADILDAFRAYRGHAHQTNRDLFEKLAEAIEALANSGIEAIPFKGPVLAMRVYGEPGLGMARDPHVLIRNADLAPAIVTLRNLGYEREKRLTMAQSDLIHRLQGQEAVFNQEVGSAIMCCTRLTSMAMTLDIDYAELWQRAQRTTLGGRIMLTPAPEDEILILAIHGGKELWWNIQSVRDFAALIGSRPKLDWIAIAERARAQGCLRMLLLAISLSHRCFNATVPEEIAAALRADPNIELMVGRIFASWQADETVRPPGNKTFSMDRLRLHDGFIRRGRYLARTSLLPGPHHVASVPLPRHLDFAYVPIGIAHDVLAWPLWRAYRQARAQAARSRDALGNSGLAFALKPASAEARLRRKQLLKARADAKRELTADPNNAAGWRQLGQALSGLKRYRQAVACYDKALAIAPDSRAIWESRRAAMRAIGKKAEPDLTGNPQDADAWAVRAGWFWLSGRLAEAIKASDRALRLDPTHTVATRLGIRARLHSCDWHRREEDKRQIAAKLNAGEDVIRSIDHLALCDSEAQLRRGSELTARRTPQFAVPLWRGERYHHDKIRIAYVSADFHDHATAFLIAGVFEHHDKAHFETTAISLGPAGGGEMRRRIEAAFDRFIDAQAMTDAEIAATLRALEIDIAIDLKGYTAASRLEIFARKPAPVQVNYLGYPGTLAASFIDYIIADRVVIPAEHRIHYSEKVVYLPHNYLPNDSKRRIAHNTPTRAEAGLPEAGMVFACFNNSYKIGPEVFDVWMRLLGRVENSILWLIETNASVSLNLRLEAEARGIFPARLIFAPRVPSAEHLARQSLADFFLDTPTCNAHTTASDALWAGLPVLTCMGSTFAGRVAGSLLQAIGLPELVTTSLAEYEEQALALARDPGRLAALKAKLMHNRDIEPLFDTQRFTRNLEAAYTAMWERTQRGELPQSFSVSEGRGIGKAYRA